MKTKIEIKERPNAGIIIVDFPNGNRVTITASDTGELNINSANGSLSILPCMSNDIRIKINE